MDDAQTDIRAQGEEDPGEEEEERGDGENSLRLGIHHRCVMYKYININIYTYIYMSCLLKNEAANTSGSGRH